jgi:hypothetical protein
VNHDWRGKIADRRSALSHRAEDLFVEWADSDRGLLDEGTRVRRGLADDPGFLAMAGSLDRGLVDSDGSSMDVLVQRPPLIARLVIPNGGHHRRRSQNGPRKLVKPEGNAGAVGNSMVAFVLILAMWFGATSAAFVFHERLSQIVLRW